MMEGIELTTDSITVLIAEDNMVNMLLIKTFTERIAPNAIMLEANNGLEAIAHCEKKWPDLVFMDVQMPEMNGYDATRKIREMETNGHVPIIALTAGAAKGEREKCLEAGMDDFVVKPVVEETIAAVIDKWLNINGQKTTAVHKTNSIDKKQHYDLSKIKEFFGDDGPVVSSFIDLVKEELALSKQALQNGLIKKDAAVLKAAGHKLYGTSATAGMEVLSQLAHEIEYMDGFKEGETQQLIDKTKAEIELVLKLMEE